MLSYYLNVPFRPGNRHALVRRLQRTPWAGHLPALAEAIRGGETFCLVGEDVNLAPATAARIAPLAVADIPACLKQPRGPRHGCRRRGPGRVPVRGFRRLAHPPEEGPGDRRVREIKVGTLPMFSRWPLGCLVGSASFAPAEPTPTSARARRSSTSQYEYPGWNVPGLTKIVWDGDVPQLDISGPDLKR